MRPEIDIYCDLPKQQLITDVEKTRAFLERTPAVTGLRVLCESSTGDPILTEKEACDIYQTWGRRRGGTDPTRRLKLYPVQWPRAPLSRATLSRYRRLAAIFGRPNVLDVEGQAVTKRQRRRLAAFVDAIGESVILTTHQGHPEAKTSARINIAGIREIQALSTATAVEKYGRIAEPGTAQGTAVHRGRVVSGDTPWIVLPLYGQKFGPGWAANMRIALQKSLDLGVPRIAYWSLKHVFRNSYAAEFLKSTLPEMLDKHFPPVEGSSDGS